MTTPVNKYTHRLIANILDLVDAYCVDDSETTTFYITMQSLKMSGLLHMNTKSHNIQTNIVERDLNAHGIGVSLDYTDFNVGLWLGWGDGLKKLHIYANSFNRRICLPESSTVYKNHKSKP
jgi:hypothetical protein